MWSFYNVRVSLEIINSLYYVEVFMSFYHSIIFTGAMFILDIIDIGKELNWELLVFILQDILSGMSGPTRNLF